MPSLVSIITVVYNGVENIKKTIESTLNQTYPNKELIIIDGGSTDGTVAIINKFKNKINYYISEPDNGIYDAMNKGLKAAKGNWIIFMNAGDYFYNTHILMNIFNTNPTKYELIYGKVLINNTNQKIQYEYGWHFSLKTLYRTMPVCHQAIFYRKEIFKEVGLYNLEYKVIADHEWLVNFYKNYNGYARSQYLNKLIAYHEMDGYSFHNYNKYLSERWQLALLYFPKIVIGIYALLMPVFRIKSFLLTRLKTKDIFNKYRKFKYK